MRLPYRQNGSMSNAPAKIAAYLDNLGAAVDVAMSRIAAALRALREGEPIPPLRRVYDALASDPTSPAQLTSLADDLVDIINTLDEIWRTHSAKQIAN